MKIPFGWIASSHKQWVQGNKSIAIKETIDILNSIKSKKPKEIFEQLSYYFFLINDYKSSLFMLEQALNIYPNDITILCNLSVNYSRIQGYKKAIEYAKKAQVLDASNFTIFDTLAGAYSKLGKFSLASSAGTNSLILKDKSVDSFKHSIKMPEKIALEFTKEKKRVISFSLWGKEKRYLYGTLRNLLLAKDIYEGWELWFYVDSSVPESFIEIMKELGAIVHIQASKQTLKQKLSWRFKVANDNSVGYFIVRDCDSVISVREFNAVNEWMNSGKYFHIIRDWWTHTDLILAGLWGGVSGILPDMDKLLSEYNPKSMETPNIDQWFLRDCIWPLIKDESLIHDRCFSHHNSIKLPGTMPKGNKHIGSCEYTQNKEYQKTILFPWINQKELSYLK